MQQVFAVEMLDARVEALLSFDLPRAQPSVRNHLTYSCAMRGIDGAFILPSLTVLIGWCA